MDDDNDLLSGYVWGLDLSGSPQGAGGVGGLVLFKNNTQTPTYHFPAYDGNGNVVALVAASDGNATAQYEFSPFGETLSATGGQAAYNPFRFSSKYTDDETGLLYYGYRYYNPSTGRCPSRDPKEEKGGDNLYCYVKNTPLDTVDVLGLEQQGPFQCGLNVTAPVLSVLQDIENSFWTLEGYFPKLALCNEIYNPLPRRGITMIDWLSKPSQMLENTRAAWSWDIQELKFIGMGTRPFFSGSPECERTVTFNGQYYYASAVNYAMWGRINKACSAEFVGNLRFG